MMAKANMLRKLESKGKGNNMHHDIFLSYSHLDKHIAQELCDKFSASGIKCYLAENSIGVGEHWVENIRGAIRECDFVMILITPRSVDSKWVYLEVGAAWMENKTVIPLTQFVKIDDLPELIKNVQSRSIETEAEKLNLVYEMIKKKGVVAPIVISFDFIMDKIKVAIAQMAADRFEPNLFVGVGRGGAVCAGIFAAQFGQHQLKVVDFHLSDEDGQPKRIIDPSCLIKKDIAGKNILVIEWARQTGATYHSIKQILSSKNAGALKSYAVFWTGEKDPPNYYANKAKRVPSNPWSLY